MTYRTGTDSFQVDVGQSLLPTSSPTFANITATTINKWILTAPTTAATLTAGGDNLTYTFPAASKTIMASDYSNGSTLGAANALLTSNGSGIPNAVAITGLVLGNGASAPTAYAGVSAVANQFITALSAAGAGTLAQPATTNLSDIGTFNLSTSGSLATTSTTNPTPAAGKLGLAGIATAPTLGANGEGAIYLSTTGGLIVQGQGSTSDFTMLNKSGATVASVPTGTTTFQAATLNATAAVNDNGTAPTGTLGSGYVRATSPTLIAPILGTPTSGVATNLTGTAAGLTAGNVTTNANLTGPVTSVGNATAIAAAAIASSKIGGTTTNDNAAAGSIGEYIRSAVGATGITTDTSTNITSISLTAGDWEVEGVVGFQAAATTTSTYFAAGISTISAALPPQGTLGRNEFVPAPGVVNAFNSLTTGRKRISIASATTVYLIGYASFATSTMTTLGEIAARRVR